MSEYIENGTEVVNGPLHPHYNYNFTIVAFTRVGHGPITYVVLRTAEADIYAYSLLEGLSKFILKFYLPQQYLVLLSYCRHLLYIQLQLVFHEVPHHWSIRMGSL